MSPVNVLDVSGTYTQKAGEKGVGGEVALYSYIAFNPSAPRNNPVEIQGG
jgi:hypothetical protein